MSPARALETDLLTGCLSVITSGITIRSLDASSSRQRPGTLAVPPSRRTSQISGARAWPLLGIVFLPFATLIYALLWVPGGLTGWDWCWVVFAGMLDIAHWGVSAGQRNQIPRRQAV